MPGNAGGSSLDVVGVLEDHHCFGGDVLAQVLGLLACKVLLEQVDLVVLEDALGSALNHFFCSLSKPKRGISVHFLGVLRLVSRLCGVDLLRPT